jgi:outer membrane protein
LAQRNRLDARKQSVRLAQIDQGFSWTLDARHVRSFSPDPFQSSALVFQVSYPLFDGYRTKSNLDSSRLQLSADNASLKQTERDAIAEIESAYKRFAQDRERFAASKAALEASKINYEAVFDSRREGASQLIELLTAQVSLATAESNFVEAYYDALTSRVRLQLVTGRPLPGEDD